MPIFKLSLVAIGLISLVALGLFLPNLKFYHRARGFTLISPQAALYIPGNTPIKVYKFNPTPQALADIINRDIGSSSATFGIYLENLSTGQIYTLNPSTQFESASLYKLTVMYTIYKKASLGLIDINKPDIQQNLAAMIEVSSNDAAYYLVDNYTSWQEVTSYMQALGLSQTNLNVNPTLTSPQDMAKLLKLIADGQAVSMDSSLKMLNLMLAQKINDRIPVHLPPDVEVAHKTGDLDQYIHDAGIIIGPDNNYILVLMSKNGGRDDVKAQMATLSSDIYDFFKNQWDNPPEIL